jgi:hypothetical protein
LTAARINPAGTNVLGQAALALAGIAADPFSASPVTRAQALSWPALNNGIRVYTNLAAQLPLKAENATGGVSPETERFLSTLDPSVAPGWTLAATVEALIEYPIAYWIITKRYGSNSDGFPAAVEFVANELITAHEERTDNGTLKVDHYSIGSEPWTPRDVIAIPGYLPGILTTGAAAIRTALANIHAARMYAENPAPHIYLTDDDGAEALETDEALLYLEALATAVRAHGSAYLAGLKLNESGWSAKEIQLVEARQQDAIEAARLLSLPTHYVAAANTGSSLNYSNIIDVRRDVISSLHNFAGPIEGRLSLPDVTPRGTVVKFDSASFYQQVTPDTPPTNGTTQQTPPTEPRTPQ